MIIECPQCSTRFDVASERIPAAGVKVRCAGCRHVFRVEKPVVEKPVEESPAPAIVAPEPSSPISDRIADLDRQSTPISGDVFSDTDQHETDFDYNKFQELDSAKPTGQRKALSRGTDKTAFTGDDHPLTDSAAELSAGAAKAEEEEIFIAEGHAAPVARKSTLSTLVKILLVLFLAALIVGGIFIYLDESGDPGQKIRGYLGLETHSAIQTGQISLGPLEGKFLRSEWVGEIFVIRGEAINNFEQPRSAIQVKGVLYDQHGKPLLQKTVFCGNPITDEQLLSLPFDELEQMMGNQFGKDLSNMKVDPKKSIPFDIVFKDLPKNISEFSVKVTSSRPTTL